MLRIQEIFKKNNQDKTFNNQTLYKPKQVNAADFRLYNPRNLNNSISGLIQLFSIENSAAKAMKKINTARWILKASYSNNTITTKFGTREYNHKWALYISLPRQSHIKNIEIFRTIMLVPEQETIQKQTDLETNNPYSVGSLRSTKINCWTFRKIASVNAK